MKVIEILKLGLLPLKLLQKSCIRIEDLEYIPLYDEYARLMEAGEKKTYAVAFLSEKYGISERKVYYLLRKFAADCKIGAGT